MDETADRQDDGCDHLHWWSAERQLWWRDFDALGHFTAASYCVTYHDVFGDFMVDTWGTEDSLYVVRRITIEHLAEVRRDEGPLRVHVRVTRLGQSSIHASLVLCKASGAVASTADGVYVAWDGDGRGARPLEDAERAALLATPAACR
jgi:acyl-CoA thioesterase FadM